jgi:DNA-binding response OmpR family regulator
MNVFRKPRVLVVDDERIIANTLAMILSRSGYDALTAYCGETAIEAAPRFEPDLLISDVVMPGITGIETAIQIRAAHPACKVLLFSGQAASINILELARSQEHKFEMLLKPIHPADLLARLSQILPVSEGAPVSNREVA